MSHKFIISSKEAPVVEIDTEAMSAYVRFQRHGKIAKTIPSGRDGSIVNVDVDDKNEVVGLEIVGVREFEISVLLKKSGMKAPYSPLDRARYVGAGHLDPAEA